MPSLSIHQQTKLPGVLTDLCHVFFKYNDHFINVMARIYRRTNRKYGALKRRRSRYGRRFVRKYGRKSFKRSGRGMQRIQKRRFPARNPFGDKVQVKFKFTVGGQFVGNNQPFIQVNGAFNDLNQAATAFGTCPGFDVYPTLFQNYRVTGVKIKLTPFVNAGGLGVVGYVMGVDGILSNPSMSTLPEQRWAKYKVLTQYAQGGSNKSISNYLSTMKIAGADRTVANDIDYTGTTNTSAPFYNTVPEQLGFQFGILFVNGTNFTIATPYADYMLEFTYYTTFWGRRNV